MPFAFVAQALLPVAFATRNTGDYSMQIKYEAILPAFLPLRKKPATLLYLINTLPRHL
jgi:hypothetical protein